MLNELISNLEIRKKTTVSTIYILSFFCNFLKPSDSQFPKVAPLEAQFEGQGLLSDVGHVAPEDESKIVDGEYDPSLLSKCSPNAQDRRNPCQCISNGGRNG